jgi:hypothetical protein
LRANLARENDMHRPTRKIVAVALGTVLLVSGAGMAFAYWTNTGTGTGTAATGSNVGITVNQASVITGMYPGQAAQTLSGTFTNTNPSPVFVAAVTANPVVTIDADHPLCLPASYRMGGTATVGHEVAAGTGDSWTGLTIAMNNLGTDQDACKGATVTVTYTSN